MMNYKGVARLAAKEAKGYQLLIYETGGVIGMVGREWAYGAQVDMLQRTNGRELLAEVVRMLGRIPEEEAVSVQESGGSNRLCCWTQRSSAWVKRWRCPLSRRQKPHR